MSENQNKPSETKSQANLNPLPQAIRIKAQHAAKEAVIALSGNKPRRSDFDNSTASKYPAWLIGAVLLASVVMLAAAFLPSAIRLYDIGNNTFSINDRNSKIAAGICIILLAETGSILFTLTLAVMDNLSRTGKNMLIISAAASATIALLGNYFVALHNQHANLFEVFEALAPPLLTLATSYILKEVSLKAIERRFVDNQAYEHALKAWEHETVAPERHEQYPQLLANEIKAAIWKANKGKRARVAMGEFTSEDWLREVRREIDSDNWYIPNSQPNPRLGRSQSRPIPNSQSQLGHYDPNYPNAQHNGNGNLSGNYKVGATEQAELFFRENPDALYWKEHELVQAIGVSKGTVGAVRKRLLAELQSEEIGNHE